ncbi:MAG TPA: ArnT family glycosyltransferase [Candidatus Brocadiia bacterium]|nr:hypothetical protein [Candidatus Brocadiales bacterium]
MNNSKTNFILTQRKAVLFCLTVFFFYLCTLKNGCEIWNIDAFYYLTLAKSLITLDGYKILGIPHTLYPFGFPLLLAPVVGIFGYNFLIIQIFLITIAVFALFVCFVFLRRFYNGKLADTAFLLTGISYFFWSFNCNIIVSEIPYLLFSLLALIVAQKSLKEDNNVIRNAILLSVLILAAYFTRLVGIALLAAVCIFACKPLIKRQKDALKRLGTILIICGIAIGAWYVRGKLLENLEASWSYEQEFAQRAITDKEVGQPLSSYTFTVIKRNLINNTTHIASLVTSIPKFPHSLRFWGYLISLLFVIGFLYSLIKKSTVVEWYLAFYIGIHLLWPYDYVRFWYPVAPLVFFYLLKTLSLIKENLLSRGGSSSWWKAIFFSLLFCGFFLVYIPLSETQYYEGGLMGYYQMIVTFVFVIFYFFVLTTSFIFAFYEPRVTGYESRILKIAFAILIFHSLSMIAYRTYLKHQDYGLRTVGKLYFQEMGQWLRQNSNKDDVVMCDGPVVFGVFSERSCVQFPKVPATQDIIDTIQKENVRYVLIESNKKPFLQNLRELEVFHVLNFKEILQVEGNLLLKIEHSNLP